MNALETYKDYFNFCDILQGKMIKSINADGFDVAYSEEGSPFYSIHKDGDFDLEDMDIKMVDYTKMKSAEDHLNELHGLKKVQHNPLDVPNPDTKRSFYRHIIMVLTWLSLYE